jgi:uncharacterized protein with FMN-binding domain
MKTKKKILIVVAAVLLIGLAIGAKFMLDVQSYQNQIAAMQISEIDLSNVPDGTYEGSYDADLIKVKVLVDVKDHTITNIDLVQHENGKGAPGEAVIPEVIESQSLEVDAVSGATNSSKVILKSIELAITSAKN